MATFNQKITLDRTFKTKKCKTPKLDRCPQKKGICEKILVLTPKKPNSALRKATRV